jgi:starch synthase
VKPATKPSVNNPQISVTMFSSEYPPCWGGVGKHVQNLCRRLQNYIDLRLVTATYGQPIEQFPINNLARLRVRNFPFLLAQYLSGLRFIRLPESRLVHVHVPHAFLPRGRKHIVSTFHVVWADYADVLSRQRPMSVFDLQLAGMNHRLVLAERKLAETSDLVIAVSQSVKHDLVSRYGVDPLKVHVVHNGVDVEKSHPSRQRENMFLYLGRQTAHKGLPYLLTAFGKFARIHKNYKLVIVGERLEGGIDQSLVHLASELSIRDRVEFTGRLPEARTWEVLGLAKCLILPSLAEAFGMTVLEAMASETPVIATRVGGIPDVVRNGRNGLLVPPADPDSLADSMERIAADSRLRRKLAEAGKQTCARFTWDEMARRTIQIYNEAIT